MPPRVTFDVVTAAWGGRSGQVGWRTRWLVRPGAEPGWIIQRVDVQWEVFAGSTQVSRAEILSHLGLRDWWPLWEAWPVQPGAGIFPHDCFNFGPAVSYRSRGKIIIEGRAQFYAMDVLPSSFHPHSGMGAVPGGGLPFVSVGNGEPDPTPDLSGGTGEIDHSLSGTWDNEASGEGHTLVSSSIPPLSGLPLFLQPDFVSVPGDG